MKTVALRKIAQLAMVGVALMGYKSVFGLSVSDPSVAVKGYVLVSSNAQCRQPSCGTPIKGAKITIETEGDKSTAYSNSSGYYSTRFVSGCGKVKITYEYQGFVEVSTEQRGYSSCLLAGAVTLSKSWIISPSDLNRSKKLNFLKVSCIPTDGLRTLKENNSSAGSCVAWAYYVGNDSTSNQIIPSWSDSSNALSVSSNGTISTTGVSSDTSVTITATYSEGGITKQAKADVMIEDSSFQLLNQNSGKCLDSDGGATSDRTRLIQYRCSSSAKNEFWRVNKLSDGSYKIINRNSDKCLDILDGSSNDWAKAIIFSCHDGSSMKWDIIPVGNSGDNSYNIRNRNSGKCLTVGDSKNDWTNVMQYPCSSNYAMRWRFDKK